MESLMDNIQLVSYIIWLVTLISLGTTVILIARRSGRKSIIPATSLTGLFILASAIAFLAPRVMSQMIIEPVGGVSISDNKNQKDYNLGETPPPRFLDAESKNQKGHNLGETPPRFLDAGGSANVNDAPYGDVFNKHYGTNPFIDTEDDNLSTFAIDVDTASYSIMRRFINDGFKPNPELVRTEEFVNYFDYDYTPPQDGKAFAIHMEGSPSPFGSDKHHLLRVGLQAAVIEPAERKPTTIILTIDSSGSMRGPYRMDLVKQSSTLLLNELGPQDRIAVVTYGDTTNTLQKPVSAKERSKVRGAIEGIEPQGSTHAVQGLQEAYKLAAKEVDKERIVRVILMSDGVANVGFTGPQAILDLVSAQVEQGVYLTTIGVGMGNFNDILMEQMANDGNGTYHYVDTRREAQRVLSQNLTGLLQNVADDAKVQVEFNPDAVRSYRLIGYENRWVKDEQFRDDSVDAGEVGSGQNATALYELKLLPDEQDPIATVTVRYRNPDNSTVEEVTQDFLHSGLKADVQDTSPAFRLAAGVAEYAEILRESHWARDGSLHDVRDWTDRLADGHYSGNADVEELADLLRWAVELDPHPISK